MDKKNQQNQQDAQVSAETAQGGQNRQEQTGIQREQNGAQEQPQSAQNGQQGQQAQGQQRGGSRLFTRSQADELAARGIRQGQQRREALRIQQRMNPESMDQTGMQDRNAAGGGADFIPQGVKKPIGAKEVQEAMAILNKYREGKANLEQRIVENEQWYRLRHWECLRRKSKGARDQIEPASGWLFNAIANKHADAMDNFPAPSILPREAGDQQEAKNLSSIIPVILDQAEFEQVYSDEQEYKLKFGTGVYGVFWDGSKLNGMGDISIRKIDLINLFWESGIQDIQDSRNVFYASMTDNDALRESYPDIPERPGGMQLDVNKYIYDDTIDTTNKSIVVDWYYKRTTPDGRQVLHYCKFVGDTVLFATENEPEYQERGWYDHGLYPFVFDPLYRTEGTPCGFGFIDIARNAQEYIDRGNQAVMENMLANARPRYFIRSDGSVNEAEYADMTKDFIHVDGNLGQDSVLPVTGKALDDLYVTILNNKIDELKEVTGNRDVSTGGTSSGITAASAIAAMQEAGSKLSRDNNKASFRAFRKVVLLVVELVRQFYDLPRQFRIIGQDGAQEFVSYSNAGIVPQGQGGSEFGVDMGLRKPLFDVEIAAAKKNPYSRMSQNELALQFFGAGFFNPQLADQALACLEMMDFDRKEFIMERIARNGTLYQQLQAMTQAAVAMAQLADNALGTNYAGQLMQQAGLATGGAAMGGQAQMPQEQAHSSGNAEGNESYVTKNAREKSASASQPG